MASFSEIKSSNFAVASAAEFDKEPDFTAIFNEMEAAFPASLKNSWDLCVLSSLTTGRYPSTAAPALYRHLLATQASRFSSSEQRAALHKRLHEGIFHLIPISGAPRALDASLALNSAVAPEDRDSCLGHSDWSPDNARSRADAWLAKLYQNDLPMFQSLIDPDFWLFIRDVVYGLHLSDHREISGVESEMIVASSLMTQGMPRESLWHLRALRRLGLDQGTVQGIKSAVEKLIVAMGWEANLKFLPTLEEVEKAM
ncbi:hypothetical protein MAJ_09883, partial [Metarhizium majus ARSEF 297]